MFPAVVPADRRSFPRLGATALDPSEADPGVFPAGLAHALPALLSLPDLALVAVDAQGVIRGWSPAATALLRHPASAVLGRKAESLFGEGARDAWTARSTPGQVDSPEWRVAVQSEDGEPIACGVHVLPMPEPPGALVLALRDRRGEETSEQRVRWLRSLLGILGDATLVLDPGGRIRELGPGWPSVPDAHGIEWHGRHVSELLGGDRREVLAALRQAAREGRWQGGIASGGGSLGLSLHAVRDDAGALDAFVGVRARPAAKPQGDLFRRAPLGMLLLDESLRVREVNAELAAQCGRSLPDDPQGLDARSLALFQGREVQSALDGLLSARDFDLGEVRLPATGDRPATLVRLQGRRLDGGAGSPPEYVLSIVPRDANSDVERQLLRAQKMESIGNFASGLAHDFGNFVAVILGKAGVLRVKLPEDPHITRDLDDIETAAKRAQHLAQELMRFARGGRNRVSRLDVNRLLEEVGALIRTSIGKRIMLDVRLENGLPPIEGDEVELQQLVLNLCLNARDAMPNGGRLIVETRPLPASQARRLAEDGSVTEGVSIIVRDTGAGMPPEILERIFEPFFTTKHEGNKGAGLGLAMVYGIVRRHGGAIDVKSRVGMGTAFEILLPAAGAGTAPARPGCFTLVVDDEPAFGEMIRLILEEDGHRVQLAANGIEALRIIREELGSLSLVILDLRMPGVDGLGVLEELRELAPRLPVLVTTGYAGPEERAQALARGARRVLEKPYRVAELRQALQEVLAGAEGPAGGADIGPTYGPAPAPR